jgi:hypothetical protein
MSFLVFQAGYEKYGEGKYGGYSETQKNEITPMQVQGIALRAELDNKYGNMIQKEKRIKFVNEMMQIDAFRYMNPKFVAASLIIIDQDLEYIDLPEVPETLKTLIFPNKQIMDKYIENLVDKSRRKDKDFTEALIKKILFNYIYKIYQSRESPAEFFTEGYEEIPEEIKIPDIEGNV